MITATERRDNRGRDDRREMTDAITVIRADVMTDVIIVDVMTDAITVIRADAMTEENNRDNRNQGGRDDRRDDRRDNRNQGGRDDRRIIVDVMTDVTTPRTVRQFQSQSWKVRSHRETKEKVRMTLRRKIKTSAMTKTA